MATKLPAYYQLIEISAMFKGISYQRTVVSESYTDNTFNRDKTGNTTAALNHNFVITNIDWLPGLSNPAVLFMVRNIYPALRRYNLLWHWEPDRNRANNRILKELTDKQVLMRTEVIGMYLINPIKLVKGSALVAVEATKELLREHGKPRPDLIKDLKLLDKYTLQTSADRFNMLQG